ncbi:transposase [Acidihalobacter ferrooxydans]|uniref:transposase n=1 Tax=Acidihalobacter ferrooxydans TaxID=1765967 RepID=UPI0018DE2D3F|nr:transposase [Acidihalobacter ferrooxydans]
MHRFKTLTTKRYTDGVKTGGWKAFRGRVWQRNYYEYIIRDEASLHAIREYIANNPMQWALDRENPANAGAGPGSSPAQPQGIAAEAWRDV